MKLDDSNNFRTIAKVLMTLFLSLIVCEPCTGVLVYPKLLESRADGSRLVLHVHPGLTLTLEKSSVLAKDLYFGSSTLKNTDRVVLNGKELEKNLYHNKEHMASLVVKRVRSSVEVRGILSHQHRIAPAVEAGDTSSGDIPHRIFEERSSSSFDANNYDNTQITDQSLDMTVNTEQPNGKHEPKLFIVETCIVTSMNYTRSFNTTEELVIYVSAMLNAVALRFSEMVCPTVKFQLNQVLQVQEREVQTSLDTVIPQDLDASPAPDADQLNQYAEEARELAEVNITKEYGRNAQRDNLRYLQMENHLGDQDEKLFGNSTCGKSHKRFTHQEDTIVCGFDAEDTLNKTIDYVNACETASCDIVYHMTSAELTFVVNGTFSTDITGLATIGGACTDLRFGLGEDKPHTYLGLMTMAHEFGHLLGAYHDGSSEAQACPAAFGNLMSTLDRGMLNRSKLSPCSQAAIRAFVSNLSATCVDVSIAGNYTNESYPGENFTADEYCKILNPELGDVWASSDQNGDECEFECCWPYNLSMDYGINSAYSDESPTEGSYDYNNGNSQMCRSFALLDGMKCGENETCKGGICGEHDWKQIRQNWQVPSVVSARARYR